MSKMLPFTEIRGQLNSATADYCVVGIFSSQSS